MLFERLLFKYCYTTIIYYLSGTYSLHFALEFARCLHRILQINYVDVDEGILVKRLTISKETTNLSVINMS